jgi:hypothetical protein
MRCAHAEGWHTGSLILSVVLYWLSNVASTLMEETEFSRKFDRSVGEHIWTVEEP